MYDQIEKDLVAAYGSLDHPNWHFVQQRFSANFYEDVMERLRGIGKVEENTDLNDDCSRSLFINSRGGLALTVRLSLVGRYACVHDQEGGFLARSDLEKTSCGEQVFRLLEEEKFVLLDSSCLRRHIKFGNEITTIYSVLFSSDELIT